MMPHDRAVLIIDDDADDIEFITRGFRKSGFENPIFSVYNNGEAIHYLRGDRQYADRSRFPVPHLVLLAHVVHGESWDFLKWIRRQPKLHTLPVVVFTGSYDSIHQQKAEELGANAYCTKPHDLDDFVATVRRIADFWLLGFSLRYEPSEYL